MYAYIKINYGIIINQKFNNKKLADISGLLLAVMLLCILAQNQPLTRQTAGVLTENQNSSENTADILGKTDWISEIPAGNKLYRESRLRSENKLNLMPVLPEISAALPQIVSTKRAVIQGRAFIPPIPEAAAEEYTQSSLESTSIDPEPAVSQPESAIMKNDSTIIYPEPTIIRGTPTIIYPEQPGTTEDTAPDSDSESDPEPDLDSDSELKSDTDSSSEQNPSEEEADHQDFLCKGFLCDSSGKIIGCQDVSIIDEVLLLPSDEACTGIAANALSSLGTQVCEIYIPANIVAIEEGAFHGLTELWYIEVHPDNPVYTSAEGALYKK